MKSFTAGRTLATMGTQFVSTAVGWELYERTNDPLALGLVGLVQVIPALMLMLPAGNAADRYRRRDVGMLSHLLLALATLGLAAVSWFAAPVELVYPLLAAIGAARAFSLPSTNTLLVQLLEPRQFANANAWVVSSYQVASISGPAFAGILIATTGGALTSYVAAAVGQAAFAVLLARMPAVAPPGGGARRSAADLFAGVAFMRRNPIFLGAVLLDLFAVLLGGAVALLPVYARDILQVGPAGLGLLRSAPPVGALAMALLTTRLPPWQRPGRVLLLVVAGFGLATIGFGFSRDLVFSMVCLALVGAFDSISMVIRLTLEQVITPDGLRGRVAAIKSLFVGLSNEMGAFESGAVAALFGPVIAVVSGGVGTLVVVALVAAWCPALVRLGPLHTLKPLESEPEEPLRPVASPASP